jgi:predicted peptidase
LRKILISLTLACFFTLVAGLIYKAAGGHTGLYVRFFSRRQTSTASTPTVPANYPKGGYTQHTFTGAQGTLPYYLYVPQHYNPQQKYPMILILSGGSERSKPGNSAAQNEWAILRNNYVQVWSGDYNGAGNPEVQQHWPSIIVVPQISISQQWVNAPVHKGSYTQQAQPTTVLLLAKELLDALQHKYSIDANRIYITGISLGGYGTWDAIERWPAYFAAAVPVSGAGDPAKAAELVNMPIWAFHGSKDNVVPVSGSRDMIAAIRAAGGSPRYTEIAGKSHEIWNEVYSLPGSTIPPVGLYSWLFSQHK